MLTNNVSRAQRWQEAEQMQANELALDVKNFQQEQVRGAVWNDPLSHSEPSRSIIQMQLKQQQRKDRKLEDRVLAEQMEWERAQVELMEGDRLQLMQAQRTRLRDAQYRAMQLDRRRANMAAMVQHFFDQLSALPAPRAIEVIGSDVIWMIQSTELSCVCISSLRRSESS